MTMSLTACATGKTTGAGCDVYRAERLQTPEVTASGDFLRWFNEMDAGMLAACK